MRWLLGTDPGWGVAWVDRLECLVTVPLVGWGWVESPVELLQLV